MQINSQYKQNFGNFYAASGNVEKNMILNRAIINVGGIFPWMFQSNNKEEKKERTANILIFAALAFAAPVLIVPALNRIMARGLNSHKLLHISNASLKDLEKTKLALPNADEALRKKLIKAKTNVLCADLLITGYTLGSLGFLNNYMTKKRTGKSGFSAELEMADSGLITNRASHYERTKKQRAVGFALGVAAISTAIPMMLRKGLMANKGFMAKHAHLFDYRKGIYMSRLAMLLGVIMNCGGLLIASRNKTEFKDWAIRLSITEPVFFGGDIVVGGLLAGLSDKIFKTKITNNSENPSFLRKIFPKTRPIEEINALVKDRKLTKGTQKAAAGIYWGNIAIVSALLGFTVPYLCNKMIKHDVAKDAARTNQPPRNRPEAFSEFSLS
ncbi:MAG: hypothetical protein LBK53_01150 [Heliobacteriaceae bacterium]|jgi:hypothetical protein|nr:hypothetical protein [Heliobacteriaceae bacterium]